MPFTPAHPAIVLPLLRKSRLSALGLVAGSMAPDFEYFFKMEVDSHHSHTLAGLFYFDLPVTVLLGWLFIRFVRTNLFANLPPYFQRRLRPIENLEVRSVFIDHWLIFLISALLGSLSHLFWDGFTHNNTFFVRNLSFYQGTYVPYHGVKYPLWYALQHISSAIGLSVMLVYLVQLPALPGTVRKPSFAYWIMVALVALLVVVLRFKLWPGELKEGNIIVSAISGLCCGLVIAGMTNFNNAMREVDQ
ncbi:MAG TPA: DUF4184 family protein [Chryseolinea sp.]|nr:DUF4184 family protein [Chryseolinea sp.]